MLLPQTFTSLQSVHLQLRQLEFHPVYNFEKLISENLFKHEFNVFYYYYYYYLATKHLKSLHCEKLTSFDKLHAKG